ncbi:MAG: mechanosensitive ion channel [Saccharospirillaceae bacterium]|nr:mechanosensitive ion channel [Pseudomonadales bacterium]NRB78059.1 mechanosensitive ion channel [Saccharospirillaceae bacterium]
MLKLNKFFTLYRCILLFIGLLILISAVLTSIEYFKKVSSLNSAKNTLTIALIGPMQKSKGEKMYNGAKLYIDQYNATRDKNKPFIKLEKYNDLEQNNEAIRNANKIVKNPNVIAVLGHRGSNESKATAKIYSDNEIVMVGGSATDPAITQDNPWIFSVVPNNKIHGRFVAEYINEICNIALTQSFTAKSDSLLHKCADVVEINLVYSSDQYGKSLQQSFVIAAEQYGFSVKEFELDVNTTENKEKKYDERAKVLIDKIKSDKIVFFAVGDDEAKYLVKYYKTKFPDGFWIGSASIGKQNFPENINALDTDEEVGIYSNEMYAIAPMIFDLGNASTIRFVEQYNNAFNEDPDVSSASYYDAAKTVVTSIINTPTYNNGLNDKLNTRVKLTDSYIKDTLREELRAKLENTNSIKKAIKGLNSQIYFNENGTAIRPMSVGLFSHDEFISAPIQLQDFVKNNNKQKRTQINVVYTGIEVLKITEFSLRDKSFKAKFNLWFRNAPSINAQDIVFLSAVDDIQLGEPVKLIESKGIKYQRFIVEGRFKVTANPGRAAFGEYELGIHFRHKTQPRNKLIYVYDVVGSKEIEGKTNDILQDGNEWKIASNIVYQDTLNIKTLGSPLYLNNLTGAVDFSRFNEVISVRENTFSLRGRIPVNIQHVIFFVSSIIWLMYVLFLDIKFSKTNKTIYSIGNNILFGVTLIALEPMSLNWLANTAPNLDQINASYFFDILWWIYFGVTVAKCIDLFIWNPIEVKSGRPVPKIMRHLTRFLAYIGSLFFILSFVFERELTSLLATSGLVAMILGLALQSNLVNIFSGIAISLEKPFKLGDWISIPSTGGAIVGKVFDMNWRSTRLTTADNTIYSIPNNTIANANLNNISSSGQIVIKDIEISVAASFNPQEVIQQIQATLKKLKDVNQVTVQVGNIGSEDIIYNIKLVHKADTRELIEQSAWQEIWSLQKSFADELVMDDVRSISLIEPITTKSEVNS